MPHLSGSIPEEMLLGQYIPLHYHYNMLQDHSRMEPFREAIDFVVPFSGKVVELGGGTGVLSFFAARKAEKVWCVERNPALVLAAKGFLANNSHGDRVEVVQADALTFVPPEPVDVVICEMLHVGLIREKQLEVLRAFKSNYLKAFGPKLPVFIPDTSLLGVQLTEQNFHFSGYHAPVPLFLPPGQHAGSRAVSDPEIYGTVDYETEIPTEFHFDGCVTVQRTCTATAVSFLTKNFLAFQLAEGQAVQWMMNQLILPLRNSLAVRVGDQVTIRFSYTAGCPIEALHESITVDHHASSVVVRRAA